MSARRPTLLAGRRAPRRGRRAPCTDGPLHIALLGDEWAGLLLRPVQGLPWTVRTQGSASLHPGLRSYAASRLNGSTAQQLNGPGLEGSKLKVFKSTVLGLALMPRSRKHQAFSVGLHIPSLSDPPAHTRSRRAAFQRARQEFLATSRRPLHQPKRLSRPGFRDSARGFPRNRRKPSRNPPDSL